MKLHGDHSESYVSQHRAALTARSSATTATTNDKSTASTTMSSTNDKNPKESASWDAASISTSSIASEKERAQAEANKKPSLLKRAVTGMKDTLH
ncbi:hypothetical protein, variant 2 [Exophiala oligosperma]|uniref:Uncharacterized protein n=2 Tax=Chaetothyriales TaxID=34395 RepID=A0A0D2DMH8_9EURO|nr:hypothetical protein, variant 2 [Exophiala oligosperma]KIW43665.1 hypothetical protein, variant 2 [Exophiala oligosperma]